MANYSTQKLKSVSLNNGPRRFSDPNSSRSAQKNSPAKTGTRPLISPVSEAVASSNTNSAGKQSSSKFPSFDWTSMFNRTFLSVYIDYNDPLVDYGKFDYAFKLGNQRLYVLVHQETTEVDSVNVPKNLLSELRQQAATQINKRFQHINAKVNSSLSEDDNTNPYGNDDNVDNADEEVIHYVGITSIMIIHNGEQYQIEHEYGSSFFQEECVFDLDDESKVLQLFSLNSFYQMIKVLQTPSDLISYYGYHLQHLINFDSFENELQLAEQFLNTADFYERAVSVQEKLVEIGLMSKVETRLIDIISHADDDNTEYEKKRSELQQELQSYSSTFQKLLNGTTKRRDDAGETLPLEQVKILVAESMYTRLSIIEEMMAYETRSKEDCLQGYLSHQHSYNDFGHHYVIIFYGLAPDADYSREYVEQNYKDILLDINAQLQEPVMDEFFILGFDMSNHDGKGNVTVEMDVFHQSGVAL